MESNHFRMEELFLFNELLEKNDNLWMLIYQYLFTTNLKNVSFQWRQNCTIFFVCVLACLQRERFLQSSWRP